MKKKVFFRVFYTLVLLFVFPLFFSCVTTGKTAKNSFYKDNIGDFSSKKLSNGISVYFKQNRGSKIVVLKMVFEGGVPLYEGNIDGIEQFAFDFMLHGSEKYSYEDLQKLQFEKSFSIGSSCGKDYSTVGFTCIQRDFDDVLEIFSDLILHPRFYEKDFSELQTESADAIVRNKADPSGALGIALSKVAFEKHPYAVSSSFREESFEKIKIETVKKHYNSLLNSSRLKIVLVGDFAPEMRKKTTEKLDDFFNSIPKKPYSNPVIPDFTVTGKTLYVENAQAGDSGYIAGVFDCPERNSPEYIPFAIATMFVDDIFFDQIREKAGALYSAGTGIAGGKKLLGAFSLYKANNSQNLKKLVENAVNSFDEAKAAEAIEEYKNKYVTTVFNSAVNSSGIADNMIASLVYFGSETAYLRRAEQIDKVTEKQVVSAYNKYIKKAVQDGKCSWAVVGSADNVKTFGF